MSAGIFMTAEERVRQNLPDYRTRLEIQDERWFRSLAGRWRASPLRTANVTGQRMELIKKIKLGDPYENWVKIYTEEWMDWHDIEFNILKMAREFGLSYPASAVFWWINIMDWPWDGHRAELLALQAVKKEFEPNGYNVRIATTKEDYLYGVDIVVEDVFDGIVAAFQVKGGSYFNQNQYMEKRMKHHAAQYQTLLRQQNVRVEYILKEALFAGLPFRTYPAWHIKDEQHPSYDEIRRDYALALRKQARNQNRDTAPTYINN